MELRYKVKNTIIEIVFNSSNEYKIQYDDDDKEIKKITNYKTFSNRHT